MKRGIEMNEKHGATNVGMSFTGMRCSGLTTVMVFRSVIFVRNAMRTR